MRWNLVLSTSGALAVAAMTVGCQAQPAAADGQAVETALLRRIEAEVGDAACTSTAQCHTLAIGAKPCGGPAGWLAWSSANTSAERLAPLAQELAQRQRSRADAEGRVSNCSMVSDPGAVCLLGAASASQFASQFASQPGQPPGRCVLARTRSAS